MLGTSHRCHLAKAEHKRNSVYVSQYSVHCKNGSVSELLEQGSKKKCWIFTIQHALQAAVAIQLYKYMYVVCAFVTINKCQNLFVTCEQLVLVQSMEVMTDEAKLVRDIQLQQLHCGRNMHVMDCFEICFLPSERSSGDQHHCGTQRTFFL